MATYMKDDELGAWVEESIADVHVEWRRRDSRADEAHFGTEKVVDVSVSGTAPQTFGDFDEKVPFKQMLEYTVGQMI